MLHHKFLKLQSQSKASLKRIGKRYFFGQILSYAGSFEDDILAMPFQP